DVVGSAGRAGATGPRTPVAPSVGAVLANVMFDRRVFEIATKHRITTGHLVGEVVVTAGLIAVIFALARTGRAALSAAAVGAYIGAAYWFTSSVFVGPRGSEKDQAELAYLDFVAVGQDCRLHRLMVDIGAVEAADVDDLEFAVLAPELGVPATGCHRRRYRCWGVGRRT